MCENPTLAVVGAGAMGSLFGGLLAEGGLDVTLVDVWQEHVDNINRDGLKIVGYGGDRFVPVKATTRPEALAPVDTVFVQCKAGYTRDSIASAANLIGDHTAVISFQNGLGNAELLAELIGEEKVLGGLTAQGASMDGPGIVRKLRRPAVTHRRNARRLERSCHRSFTSIHQARPADGAEPRYSSRYLEEVDGGRRFGSHIRDHELADRAGYGGTRNARNDFCRH